MPLKCFSNKTKYIVTYNCTELDEEIIIFIHMGKKGGLFCYADGTDKLLLLLGTLGSIGDGSMSPLTMVVLSGVINEYGASESTPSFSNDIVDKVLIVIRM